MDRAKEETVKNPMLNTVMTTTSASAKPMTSALLEAMAAEKPAATNSTRKSTTRGLAERMPTESTRAIPTTWTTTPAMNQSPKRSKFLDGIQIMIKQLMSTAGSELTRKLLQADISTDCTFGLLHFTRAIQDLEPWAIRREYASPVRHFMTC
ncbi:hypothetical protein MTO96_010420 [Rhipicephalus appendiculatus]